MIKRKQNGINVANVDLVRSALRRIRYIHVGVTNRCTVCVA